ncbi:unnamed protein product, partial [Laminaria digitata]
MREIHNEREKQSGCVGAVQGFRSGPEGRVAHPAANMLGDRQTVSQSVSQGRLSRHFHPSRRIVPPLRKKNASLFVWKPLLFVLALWVFNNMARRLKKTRIFT